MELQKSSKATKTGAIQQEKQLAVVQRGNMLKNMSQKADYLAVKAAIEGKEPEYSDNNNCSHSSDEDGESSDDAMHNEPREVEIVGGSKRNRQEKIQDLRDK